MTDSQAQTQAQDWYSQLIASEPVHLPRIEKLLRIDNRVTLHTQRQLSVSPDSDLTKIFHLLQVLMCEYLQTAGGDVLFNKLSEFTCDLGLNKDINLIEAEALCHTAQYTLFTEPGKLYNLSLKYFREVRPNMQVVLRDYFGISDTFEIPPM